MKNSIKKMEAYIGKAAYQMTKSNVNSACLMYMYQPKLPEVAKKLKKF